MKLPDAPCFSSRDTLQYFRKKTLRIALLRFCCRRGSSHLSSLSSFFMACSFRNGSGISKLLASQVGVLSTSAMVLLLFFSRPPVEGVWKGCFYSLVMILFQFLILEGFCSRAASFMRFQPFFSRFDVSLRLGTLPSFHHKPWFWLFERIVPKLSPCSRYCHLTTTNLLNSPKGATFSEPRRPQRR